MRELYDIPVVGGIPLTDPGCFSNGYHNTSCLCLNRLGPADQVSDGYHTFGELYDHRRALTAVLAAAAGTAGDSWRSKAHHPDDDPMFEGGYFIVGIQLPTGVITYHYKLEHWDDFSAVPEVEHAPKWDGALPADTITRLLETAALVAGAGRN